MVQESFKALKNTNINPLFYSIQNCPITEGSFFNPYTLPKVIKVNYFDYQSLLVTL